MSAKTKIVVIHMKELILTGLLAVLGILLIIFFITMFLPKKDSGSAQTDADPPSASDVASDSIYIPGLYTTELVLGGNTAEIELIVSATDISSIRLVNLSDAVTTMYPLLQPAFDSICEQVYKTQSLEGVTYTLDSKYTSLVLLEAIRSSLNKATRAQ